MEFFVHIEGRTLRVELDGDTCRVDGRSIEVELADSSGTPVRSARVQGRSLRVRPHRNGRGDWSLDVEGIEYRAEVLDPGQEAIRAARQAAGADSGPAPLRAPMPGLVVGVEVAEGDLVEVGQGLVIVEAMKMENELKAEASARVKAVRVEPGMPVEKDQILVEFEAEDVDADGGEA
jgi:biotin carboxyl carrier protein